MAPAIGAREIDGLPKASMGELLVTKQVTNTCDRVGRYIAIPAVNSEVKRGLKSNEACGDNLEARI